MLKITQKKVVSRYGILVKVIVSVGFSQLVQVKRIKDMERSISLKSKSTKDGGVSIITFPASLGVKHPNKIKKIIEREVKKHLSTYEKQKGIKIPDFTEL